MLDETVLTAGFPLHDEWARTPLQLRLFGDHLAGEGFFEQLKMLRAEPEKNIEALEVYHTCLLLGFQGKYLLEGQEKLDYLVHQLGQDIRRIRGEKTDFAPNWKLPHRFQNYMRHEMPRWFYFGLMALISASFFGVYSWLLNDAYMLAFGGAQ
jgi:type VI secretion system protein ImpK